MITLEEQFFIYLDAEVELEWFSFANVNEFVVHDLNKDIDEKVIETIVQELVKEQYKLKILKADLWIH